MTGTPSTGGGQLPLAGVTVVSLEQAVAGPMATRHLADLGARVIKLERPGEGDFARSYDTAVNGLASHFVWLNRSKESVCVDLKTEEGRAAVKSVIDSADVFLQNCAPGVAERLGLDATTLRASRPSLVVLNISGYGSTGPKRDRKAYDMLIQAESGMVSVTGTPETPTKTGIPSADIAAAMYAAMSILAALFRRDRTGDGATIEVSMFDSAVEWMGYGLYTQLYAGHQVPRMGLGHASITPYNAYPTKDGSILIGVQNDRGWRSLVADVFGREDLADHPKFRTNVLRVENRVECDQLVADEARTWLTADLDERLAEVGVPAAQINDLKDLIGHDQLAQRDRWRSVETENGPIKALLPPMVFSDVELRMDAVPGLGSHTTDVLGTLGGPEGAVDEEDNS
jgi:itaconate CoA-transferase